MSSSQLPRRTVCARCQRPSSACICGWITPIANKSELLILQHPMEVANAKGSARLLQLSLAESSIAVGECFDAATLDRLLFCGQRTPVLLYPDTPGEQSLGLARPAALDPGLLRAPGRLRLVVLDGTWRKSRKMLYQNPALQTLPRLPLSQMPPSHYLIRKAHAPDQLSTLEASCYALGQLEGDPAAYQPLLEAFDRFVAHFLATAGKLATGQALRRKL